jgi:hypothetical protein
MRAILFLALLGLSLAGGIIGGLRQFAVVSGESDSEFISDSTDDIVISNDEFGYICPADDFSCNPLDRA